MPSYSTTNGSFSCKDMDELAFDPAYDGYEELDFSRKCIRLTWTYQTFPVCNTFHEMSAMLAQPSWRHSDLTNPTDPALVEFLGQGYFRDSWRIRSFFTPFEPEVEDGEVMLKSLRLDNDDYEFDYWTIALVHVEALAFERLSASKRTTDIYGHCATSMLVQPAFKLSNLIVPDLTGKVKGYKEQGRIPQKHLDRLQRNDVHPFNNFTAEEKLNIAIEIAESIAEMHGFEGGVIVNDDIHPDQWLITKHGRIMLNDMSNAAFLEWHPQQQRYRRYWNSYTDGDYHSPEEYNSGSYIDESVDIWPMGNILFSLLTGLWPYYEHTSQRTIQKLTVHRPPYLDRRYRRRSLIEGRLVELMNKCHQVDPNRRIDIFEVVRHLRETRRRYYEVEQDD